MYSRDLKTYIYIKISKSDFVIITICSENKNISLYEKMKDIKFYFFFFILLLEVKILNLYHPIFKCKFENASYCKIKPF